jgi:hypothetical protein
VGEAVLLCLGEARGGHACELDGFAMWKASDAIDALLEVLAFDQLHREEEAAELLTDEVDVANVRVIDARLRASLAHEAVARGGVVADLAA